MALKDLLSLFDPALEAVFHRKEAKPEELRAPLLKGIDQMEKQFLNGSTKAPNRWWKTSNGVVAVTVKLKGDTFDINGVATNHFPEERFKDFVSSFRSAVTAGDFDKELKNHGNGDAKVDIGKGTGKKRVVSEEARQKMRDAHARRKAANAAG